jgi:hypothetical protein
VLVAQTLGQAFRYGSCVSGDEREKEVGGADHHIPYQLGRPARRLGSPTPSRLKLAEDFGIAGRLVPIQLKALAQLGKHDSQLHGVQHEAMEGFVGR